MNWKARMHPTVSRAELQIFYELQRLGLTEAMVTQKPIRDLRQPEPSRYTIPDFFFIEAKLCVYIDGTQVHRNREEKDAEQAEWLKDLGYRVKRFEYIPPLSHDRKMEIVNEIRELLGKGGAT